MLMGNIVDYDITTCEQWEEKILTPVIRCAVLERSGVDRTEIKNRINPILKKWISERKEDAAFQKQFRAENRDNPYITNFMESLTAEKFIAYLQDTKDDTVLCNEYSSRAGYFDAADREIFQKTGGFLSHARQEEPESFAKLADWIVLPLNKKKESLIGSLKDFLSSPGTRLEAFLMHVKINTVFWEENRELRGRPRALLNRSQEEMKEPGEVFESALLKRFVQEEHTV